MKYLLIAAIFCLLIPSVAYSQSAVATVFGHVRLQNPDEADNLLFGMQDVTSATMTEVDQPDSNGDFEFPVIPFGTYDLYLREQGKSVFIERVVVNVPEPLHIALDSVPSMEMQIAAPSWNVGPARAEADTRVNLPDISTQPVANTMYRIEALQMDDPGIVPGVDNRLFLRGENDGPEYILDGIPITNEQSRTMFPLLDARFLESADLVRGSLDPEYGSDGILNINTKTGFDANGFGHADYSIGALGNSSSGVDLGGRLGNAFAYYASYGSFSTNRYLDPVTGTDPNHTDGTGTDYFGNITILASDEVTITALGYYDLTSFQIPNITTSSSQDQDNSILTTAFAGRIDYTISNNALLSVTGYTRRQSTSYTSNGETGISDSASLATALLSDQYFIGEKSENFESGGALSFSAKTDWFGAANNIMVGAEGEIIPMQEYLAIGVTAPYLADSSGGNPRLAPYNIAQGGQPFLVDTSATGKRVSAYIQDRISSGAWTISPGLRYDVYDLADNESGLSPRLNMAYEASDAVTLRASYNRMILEAPIENILASSSAEAAQLMGTSQSAVQSERSQNFEAGVSGVLSRYWSVDLDGYYKSVDNMIATFDVGNSGVLLPANIKNGKIYGWELELLLHDWNHFSGMLAVSTCTSLGMVPSDGSSPYADGLILGGLAQSYAMAQVGQSSFNTEQAEPLTAAFTLRYSAPEGYFFQIAGHYDSGLPFGYVVQPQNPNASNATVAPPTDAVQNLVDLNSSTSVQSIVPHATFDFSAGYNLSRFGLPVFISADVVNIFNTVYLTQFDPVFGGAHYGVPRAFLFEGELKP